MGGAPASLETSPRGADSRARPLALVTGGGGFLGGRIVELLVERGWRVRSLARGTYPALTTLGVEAHQGDLSDLQTVQRACAGCEAVFHVAARAGLAGRYRDYYEPNVTGTENVVAACRAASVTRLVFTSSPSVVFDGRDQSGIDESVPYPRRFRSHYSATKALAEQRVLAANKTRTADGRELHSIALRPHLIWGPRDNHIVPRLLARAGQLRLVGPGDNLIDTTYIDNAAEAHLLALDALAANPAARGRTFFISNGEPLPARDTINAILAAAELPPVTRHVSPRLAWLAGLLLETMYEALRLRGEPRMTRFLAEELSTAHWFNILAARVELGYRPRVSMADGLSRLASWLKKLPGRP